MKKIYSAPIMETEYFSLEDSILVATSSFAIDKTQSGDDQLSNERQNGLWDEK